MYSDKYGIMVKVIIDTSGLLLFADDGMNPVKIPLTLEDAERLNKELTQKIERIKNESKEN